MPQRHSILFEESNAIRHACLFFYIEAGPPIGKFIRDYRLTFHIRNITQME